MRSSEIETAKIRIGSIPLLLMKPLDFPAFHFQVRMRGKGKEKNKSMKRRSRSLASFLVLIQTNEMITAFQSKSIMIKKLLILSWKLRTDMYCFVG